MHEDTYVQAYVHSLLRSTNETLKGYTQVYVCERACIEMCMYIIKMRIYMHSTSCSNPTYLLKSWCVHAYIDDYVHTYFSGEKLAFCACICIHTCLFARKRNQISTTGSYIYMRSNAVVVYAYHFNVES